MLVTPHVATGALIGVTITNPLISFPLAIGSHFLLDSVVHWQAILSPYIVTKGKLLTLIPDIILALVVVSYVIVLHPDKQSYILICSFLAWVPDIDSICCIWKKPLKVKWIRLFYVWHSSIQRETRSLWGLLPQVAIVTIAVLLT